MISSQVQIINKLGLHARAAAKLATEAGRYASTVRVGIDGKMVDGKSVMSLMLLAATQGTTLKVVVEGKDESQALRGICHLINDRFGETE